MQLTFKGSFNETSLEKFSSVGNFRSGKKEGQTKYNLHYANKGMSQVEEEWGTRLIYRYVPYTIVSLQNTIICLYCLLLCT